MPFKVLAKLENLFSISQGRGFSNPKKEANLVLKLVKEKNLVLKNVFDIGSFHGDYAFEIFKKFQHSNYYLFEPDKKNFDFIKKRFSNQNKLRVFNVAISNINNEEGTFYSYGEGSLQGSLIDQDFSHLNIVNDLKQNVKIMRLDTLFEDLGLDCIDLCKIDIEGNEMSALLGAGEAIKKIKIIQFEFGQASIYSKTFFKDFYIFFSNLNFEIYRITPSKLQKISEYSESIEYFRVANFIAINKNL